MKPRTETKTGEDRRFEVTGNAIIRVVAYAPATRRLLVTLTNGSYVYKDVPPEVYETLRSAENIGGAFNQVVRQPGYEFEKVNLTVMRTG